MRPLEILLLILLLPQALMLVFPGRGERRFLRQPRLRTGLALVAALVAGLHLALEGSRWQMAPAYSLVAFHLVFSIWKLRPWAPLRAPGRPTGGSRPLRRGLGLLALLVLVASAALGALFPIPRLPPLTGPHPVGTLTLHLVDESRPEIYTPDPDDPRQLMVQVWYPAAPGPDAAPGPWMPEAGVAGPAIARRLRLPPFILDHLRLARTSAYPSAPAETGTGPFPVLLFSHGWGGLRTQNTAQVEDLASHGYVVVAIDHAYGAVVSVFPGGQAALWKRDILPFGAPQAEFDAAANQLARVWAGDLGFVLDQLGLQNAGPPSAILAGLLDLERVGVFGHSTGGGAAVEFCAGDERCRAGLAMDAWLEPVSPQVIASGLAQPFLFMRSETWEQADQNPRNDRLQETLFNNMRGDSYRLAVTGTGHFDFSSLPLFSPLTPVLGLKGPIDGRRVTALVNDYSRAFFDLTLKSESSPLLDGPAGDYPEVSFRSRPASEGSVDGG